MWEFCSQQGQGFLFLATAFTPALEPSHPPIQFVPTGPVDISLDDDYTPPYSADVMMRGALPPFSLHAFILWYWTRDNFASYIQDVGSALKRTSWHEVFSSLRHKSSAGDDLLRNTSVEVIMKIINSYSLFSYVLPSSSSSFFFFFSPWHVQSCVLTLRGSRYKVRDLKSVWVQYSHIVTYTWTFP